MINHPEQSYRYSRRPADLNKIWMDLQEKEEEEESCITPDHQISESYSNEVGHGVGLIPFRGNGLKFSS